MSTHQRSPHCRQPLVPCLRQHELPQPLRSVLRGDSSINLAELAQAIAADRTLCRRVIKEAIHECGWPAVTVEQAIVLLGRERLIAQLLRVLELKS